VTAHQRRIVRRILPWAVTFGLLALWELVCRIFQVPQFILPPPSAVAAAMVQYDTVIIDNAGWTLLTTLIGFGIAIVCGVLLGLAIGASALVYSGIYPVLVGFNSIPKVALVPVFVIWFGIGTVPAILTAFALSFFPIAVNVATGIATVEPEMRDVLRALGASEREILLKAGIPRSLPYLFASLKVAMTLAFVGSVISETVASNRGIGYLMLAASSRFQVSLVFAGVAAVALMGIAMYAICVVFEQRMVYWAYRSGK
jgi:NitT/TauT family transport system permease protein